MSPVTSIASLQYSNSLVYRLPGCYRGSNFCMGCEESPQSLRTDSPGLFWTSRFQARVCGGGQVGIPSPTLPPFSPTPGTKEEVGAVQGSEATFFKNHLAQNASTEVGQREA